MTWRDKADEYPWISFEGGPFTGKFIKGEEGENKYGSCVKFTFETDSGKVKTLETSSKRLIGIMSNIPDGTKIKIFRQGKSTETRYEVSVVSKPTIENLTKTPEETEWDET